MCNFESLPLDAVGICISFTFERSRRDVLRKVCRTFNEIYKKPILTSCDRIRSHSDYFAPQIHDTLYEYMKTFDMSGIKWLGYYYYHYQGVYFDLLEFRNYFPHLEILYIDKLSLFFPDDLSQDSFFNKHNGEVVLRENPISRFRHLKMIIGNSPIVIDIHHTANSTLKANFALDYRPCILECFHCMEKFGFLYDRDTLLRKVPMTEPLWEVCSRSLIKAFPGDKKIEDHRDKIRKSTSKIHNRGTDQIFCLPVHKIVTKLCTNCKKSYCLECWNGFSKKYRRMADSRVCLDCHFLKVSQGVFYWCDKCKRFGKEKY